ARAGSTRWGQIYLHSPDRLRYGALIALAAAAGFGVDAWRAASTIRARVLLLVPGAAFWAVAPPLVGIGWPWLRVLAAGMAFAVAVLVASSWRPALVILLPIGLAAELVTAGLLAQSTYNPQGSQHLAVQPVPRL